MTATDRPPVRAPDEDAAQLAALAYESDVAWYDHWIVDVTGGVA
jgi:hypothetical protein